MTVLVRPCDMLHKLLQVVAVCRYGVWGGPPLNREVVEEGSDILLHICLQRLGFMARSPLSAYETWLSVAHAEQVHTF